MPTILLIEDHHDISEMVGSYLESCDYVVDYAADGVTGLHLAVSQDFDAIILDLILPGMDGLEVCRWPRQDAGKDTPLLMLTARDTLEDKVAGLDADADDYLVKPFEIEELEARMQARVIGIPDQPSMLRIIQAFFSWICMRWVSRSAVGSSADLSTTGNISRAVRTMVSWPMTS